MPQIPHHPAPALFKECANLHGAFHRAFQRDQKILGKMDGPTMPDEKKNVKPVNGKKKRKHRWQTRSF